ncbi:MAG TPA: AAA family ATPase, partial [Methylophilaceae bacterium]|nr:AAA family ATPase [Methylophilaceae bacterium]
MLQILDPQDLTLTIDAESLGFTDTSQLVGKNVEAVLSPWIGQAEAEKAARFGLGLKQPGFHLLVLGEPGSGRRSLMQQAMQQVAATQAVAQDLVYLNNFDRPEKPLALYVKAGAGAELRGALEHLVRQLARTLPAVLQEVSSRLTEIPRSELLFEKPEAGQALPAIGDWLDEQLARLRNSISMDILNHTEFRGYLAALKADVLENLEAFQLGPNAETDELESALNRYRANLLVDNRYLQGAPVIYDEDPTLQSRFGGMESVADNAGNSPDFMRLRAGNLLRANGGMLMLHLRDLQADQQSGSQLMEKLQRFLRNNSVQIEDGAGVGGHGTISHLTST